jgi:type IV secretion system protein VirD4
MEALERRLAERMVVDFVRPEKAKAGTPVEPEPKLAAEIVAREEIKPKSEPAMTDYGVPSTPEQAEVAAEPEVHLDALRPPVTISIARMSKFTQKVCELGV